MTQFLSTRIFLFKMAEEDQRTNRKYLLAMARDIYHMKKKIDEVGIINQIKSLEDQREVERISNLYLEYLQQKYVA